MPLRTRRFLGLCGLCACVGCGTFSDRLCGPITPQKYYRGVAMDVAAVREGVRDRSPIALLGLDIPLSAVADTLLIPAIAYEEATRATASSEPEPPVDDDW